MYRVDSPEEQHTLALGERLGELCGPGTVVALTGDLGAGKTVFAKGVGRGLGVRSIVRSPTFILVATHEGGRLLFIHADLYRLGDADELEQLGLHELLGREGVAVIEWAERFREILPEDHLEVSISFTETGREVSFEATGPRHEALVRDLAR